MPQDCSNITTDLKLIREEISQVKRMLVALKPAYAPVDERKPEHHIVFAQKFAEFLKFFDTATSSNQTWASFFNEDATVAIANEIAILTQNSAINQTADFRSKLKVLQTQLEKNFTEQADHQPHFALFLAFLRLMELGRPQTNTLTARHLDFYYREVLQLREKPAEAGHVHLLVELQKNVAAFAIPPKTLFKAGKDDKNNEVFFKSDRELVANQAKVAALKTVFVSEEGKLCALPITNSDDGQKPELTSTDGSWQPFFNDSKPQTNAEAGFAIASACLFMAGGTRTVTLNLDSRIAGNCTAHLTTEKGWIQKEITFEKDLITIKLSGDDAAITPYNRTVHDHVFDTSLPVLMIKLKQDGNKTGFYDKFNALDFSTLTLAVEVRNLKNLAVSNDFGPIDISKPFQPFGALPQAGSALIVGSKELFQKNYSTANLAVTWQNTPTTYGTTPQLNVSLLQAGQWNPEPAIDTTPFDNSVTIPTKPVNGIAIFDFSGDEEINANSKNGFVKIALSAGFGFAEYQAALTTFLITKPGGNPPTPPMAPVIGSISLNYTATDTKLSFFHVAPFGAKKIETPNTFFPTFLIKNSETIANNKPSQAEFYIGITDLVPPQNLSLLFQVAEGTAEARVQKPEHQHLFWSYLSNNEWIDFKKNEVNDTTGELLRSGIVTLTFPKESKATSDNTLLPSGMFWVKIAVKEKSDAVCKLIRVAAQALQATFDNQNNDPAFSAKILLANTISKMEDPQAAIKKIEQPFASFGGRGAEDAEAFYTRISERLRHKDRAVALWDYEHLILEAFPQIFKVKCLNHTRYQPNESGTGIYNELAAGHVTIVTIPNQQFQKAINPLQPYTGLGVLSDIKAYLKKRVSCFVELHVVNPDFEEVKVDFKVMFYAGTDETYHINLLQEAITRFLSPWAYGGASPTFGGKIYKSALINFIEEQPYVDYIAEFKLMKQKDNIDQNELTPSKAVSILVSVPKDQHAVVAIPESTLTNSPEKCLCES